MNGTTVSRIRLGSAGCGADLSNGSERALYVPMQQVWRTVGRPHHAVNLMFTYYPSDKGWPRRACDVAELKPGMNQWDLPYDDYDVYGGGPGGNPDAEAFRQFRDVRRYGQDVNFTLTVDLKVGEKALRRIARDLVPYGRVFFRINHECNGVWFQHNKRYSYKQVSDFFVKFHRILKEETPLVQTVLCVNGFETAEQLKLGEQELAGAVKIADIVAIDRYLSLHYGWPNKYTRAPNTYFDNTIEQWWAMVLFNRWLLCETRGSENFPVTLPELNADADVNGYKGQAERITALYRLIAAERPSWLKAVTLYQFRDRGGLGLQLEDPRTHKYVKTLPSCAAYREAIAAPFFQPAMKRTGALCERDFPLELAWRNSDDADGIRIAGLRPASSPRCVLKLDKGNYIVECNGTWFHTEGGRALSLERATVPGERFEVNLFAPPSDGVNSTGSDGRYLDHYSTIIRSAPVISF